MSHTLKIEVPHSAARVLADALATAKYQARSIEDRVYLQSLEAQLMQFAETTPPTPIKVTVIARDGVPVKSDR